MTPTMMMMWHVTVGCSMLEPLPQGMHDHRVSFAENEARRDWPSRLTEDSVATQSPTHSWTRRRGNYIYLRRFEGPRFRQTTSWRTCKCCVTTCLRLQVDILSSTYTSGTFLNGVSRRVGIWTLREPILTVNWGEDICMYPAVVEPLLTYTY